MSGADPSGLLTPGAPVSLGAGAPQLIVVIDTEEEFDWGAPHDRGSTAVTAMAEVGRVQSIFDEAGVRPCYVMDYPVASQAEGYRALREIFESGRCVIGSHLHPWVNPPHEEPVNARNSFPGNLDPALEEAKLAVLGRTIEDAFGTRPVVYKAGRYGLGPNSGAILERLGYRVDLSPTPGFDYSPEAGPDFSGFPNQPYRFGSDRRMLCLPCTGGFVGFLGGLGGRAHRWADAGVLRRLRAPGVLARLRAVERIRLSPEGYTLDELRRATRFFVRRGLDVVTLSFHSPSVVPGMTPYVRSPADLERFLGVVRSYLAFFVDEMGGRLSDPIELLGMADGVAAG